MKRNKTAVGIMLAILAAALYAINAPFSKLLLDNMPTMLMAGLLYLGAGLAMLPVSLIRKARGGRSERRITRNELPYTLGMIVLDIAAPICLLTGLATVPASSASLLNNFEIAATALIALLLFNERISGRLWAGIAFIIASCTLLSFDGTQSLQLSSGALMILLACVCWGLENNCTRMLSSKDPLQVVLLKGIFSGLGSVVIGLVAGERFPDTGLLRQLIAVLLLGGVAYGMSIYVYVYAQRLLGAARTSAYYAIAPFIGTALSLCIFGSKAVPTLYLPALCLMLIGAWFASKDEPIFRKNKK